VSRDNTSERHNLRAMPSKCVRSVASYGSTGSRDGPLRSPCFRHESDVSSHASRDRIRWRKRARCEQRRPRKGSESQSRQRRSVSSLRSPFLARAGKGPRFKSLQSEHVMRGTTGNSLFVARAVAPSGSRTAHGTWSKPRLRSVNPAAYDVGVQVRGRFAIRYPSQVSSIRVDHENRIYRKPPDAEGQP